MKYNRIGIICAMASEADKLLAAMTKIEIKTVGSMEFHLGTIGKKEVVLCVCGIGKVFAAVCAQTMLLTFAPDCLINSGVAGSLTDKLDILDIAVAKELVQHDMDTSPLGDPVGMISGINRVYLPADEELADCIEKAAADLGVSQALLSHYEKGAARSHRAISSLQQASKKRGSKPCSIPLPAKWKEPPLPK